MSLLLREKARCLKKRERSIWENTANKCFMCFHVPGTAPGAVNLAVSRHSGLWFRGTYIPGERGKKGTDSKEGDSR